jgi:hypothetical protein
MTANEDQHNSNKVARGPYRVPSKGLLAKRNPEAASKRTYDRASEIQLKNQAMDKQIKRDAEKKAKLAKELQMKEEERARAVDLYSQVLKEKLYQEQRHKEESEELLRAIQELQAAANAAQETSRETKTKLTEEQKKKSSAKRTFLI